MLKGSLSLKRLRWLDELAVEAVDRLCQKLRLDSGGDGCNGNMHQIQEYLERFMSSSYR